MTHSSGWKTIRYAERSCIWYEAHGIGRKEFKIKRYLDEIMPTRRKEFAVCIRNNGYEASLERRKIYDVLPDAGAEKHKQLRIVDESGEDYLYPNTYFARIELPQTLRKAIVAGA